VQPSEFYLLLKSLSLDISEKKSLYFKTFFTLFRSLKMKITIPDIPDEGLHIDLEETPTLDGVSLLSPVRAGLEVNKTGSEIVVTGMVAAEIELQCSRCLKVFRRKLEFPVEVVYHPLEELGDERHELRDDELDMGFYKGEELDLDEFLKEQLLLNIQMKPLCSEDCKGLCPVCGTDLNVAKCACDRRKTDPRLEVLKNFLEKRKE
jgi:DUF177 domain-containing protein